MKNLTMFDTDCWNMFFNPGEVVEIRFLKARGTLPFTTESVRSTTLTGYFDNHQDFCKHVEAAFESLIYDGCYFSLQVIDRRLLARAFNRLKIATVTTSDKNTLFYRWLPLDFDPVRPADISSSDKELKNALDLRDTVANWMTQSLGFSLPIRAMSGNGGHLLFRLPDLPVSPESISFIKNTLAGLATRFDTDTVKIDRSVYNPSRIWKLYGSIARKGDHLPAGPTRESRPHRASHIEYAGGN